ncbi:MAG: aminotransferase class I/II-fold pyridoxal phosphate-dependent enzyme [Proteobacteria bacterium]|nr:aminotransferase class I/II-fold pyridoxal phosphate-dependent enzyme [Pseudomonadota bacterium]
MKAMTKNCNGSSDTPGELPIEALTGSVRDFQELRGSDLIGRVQPFFDWQDLRRQHDLWSYSKATNTAPTSHSAATSDSGVRTAGVNFASQDYLSLSSHEAVKAAAKAAIDEYGVHSAGSSALLGNTRFSLQLEQVVSEFLGFEHTVLYPTGWSAGFGVVQGLVRPDDHVLMDILTHSCLQEGAKAATRNIHFHGHLNVDRARQRLARIRANDPNNAIMVITESQFSMHADTPDLRGLHDVCREYNALLVIDVAHDLGCVGETGHGQLGLQNMLGDADLIIGSFSKTFASNGGFVATRSRAVKEYLKYYSATQTFSNAMSPAQAASVLQAFEIVRSDEGAALRRKLMDNVLYLRAELGKARLEVTGVPGAVVPVNIGTEGSARIAARRLAELAAIVNLVEYPAVPKGNARFRLQVMANHNKKDIDTLVRLMATAVKEAEVLFRPYGQELAATAIPTPIRQSAARQSAAT